MTTRMNRQVNACLPGGERAEGVEHPADTDAAAVGGERAVDGRPVAASGETGSTHSGASGQCAVLQVRGVERSFATGVWPRRRRTQVLRGVDLSVDAGEVVGLVGENGSGKSTLMKVIVGALPAHAGTVSVTGTFGYCPQLPQLYPRLTCREHLDLFAAAYRLPEAVLERRREELFEELNFARYADVRADRLSGGTVAKLNLSVALLAEPDLLLLDEPYAGFDWETYQMFWTMMARRQLAGSSVLIISHFVADTQRFDRIVRLHDGLVDAGPDPRPVPTAGDRPAGEDPAEHERRRSDGSDSGQRSSRVGVRDSARPEGGPHV